MMIPKLKSIARRFITLNLFGTLESSEATIHDERLSTRLYLVLLNMGIFTTFLYMLLAKQMAVFTINRPSLLDYEKMITLHSSSSMDCPCSNIAIEYRSFVTTDASLHQVCSSDFISESWIERIYPTNLSYTYPMDTRRSLSAHAQLLRSFCSVSDVIVSDSMLKFGSSSLIASRLMSESLLRIQVNSSVDLVRTISPTSSMILPLLAIRRTTFGNQLVSGLGTNFHVEPQYLGNVNQGTIVDNAYVDFNATVECFCRDWTTQCLLAGAIYERQVPIFITDLNYLTNLSYVLGTKAGCLPIESLLSSTLECYFDEGCVRLLLRLSNSSSLLFSPLNTMIQSRFNLNSTVEALLNNLFIETWNTTINYTNFFSQCEPSRCTYTNINSKYSLFYIFNAMLGISGGLVIALRLIVPFIVRILRKLSRCLCCAKRSIRNNTDDQNGTDNTIVSSTNHTNIIVRLRAWASGIWTKMTSFDLFPSTSDDQSVQHHGRFATYIYLVLLFVSLIILVIYNTIAEQMHTIIIFNPDMKTFEQLEQKYGESVECPCSNIAIAHQYFIRFETIYHPICTSDLVSPIFYEVFTRFSWIGSSLELNSVSTWYFQLLNTFCSLTNSTLINAQIVFDATEWIATVVPSRRIFDNRTHIIVSYFINNTRYQFVDTLQILRKITSGSQLMSVDQSSFSITFINRLSLARLDPALFLGFSGNTTTRCSCIRDLHCSTEAGQFQYNYPSIAPVSRLWAIPGIKVSCTPIDSLMQSTLECWYDPDCIEKVITYFENDDDPITLNITAIDLPSASNSFQPNTIIEEIIVNLMLDKWEASISYDDFFAQCAPISCTYKYTSRNDVFYVVSCIIALFGGLNMVLHILTPMAVKMFFKIVSMKRSRSSENVVFNCQHRFTILINYIYQSARNINRFSDQTSNASTIQHERTVTRLYIFCLSGTTFVLLMYMCVAYQTKTITIKYPIQSTYEDLVEAYPNTLIQCPCTQVSVPYKTLVTTKFDLHQVCTSDFVSSSWLDLTFGNGNWTAFDQRDFRVRGFAYFIQLASLCGLANDILINELKSFNQNELVSAQMIPHERFEIQLQTTVKEFHTSVATTFIRTIQLFRDTIQGNQLISIYTTNWIFTPGPTLWAPFNTKPLSHGSNCSCATSSTCVESAAMYSLNITLFHIPGLVLGCLPIESLLRSTLECFYNQTCINTLIMYLNNTSANNTNFTALDTTVKSDFSPNMTIDELVSRLFVESASQETNISYSSFYSQCAPALCTYTISERNDALFIFTSILGLYGGLMKTFRHLVPAMMAIYTIILRKVMGIRNNRIASQISVIGTTTNTDIG